MTTDREMEDVVVTSAEGEDVEFVELGQVTVDTKGSGGFYLMDGGAGWWW